MFLICYHLVCSYHYIKFMPLFFIHFKQHFLYTCMYKFLLRYNDTVPIINKLHFSLMFLTIYSQDCLTARLHMYICIQKSLLYKIVQARVLKLKMYVVEINTSSNFRNGSLPLDIENIQELHQILEHVNIVQIMF